MRDRARAGFALMVVIAIVLGALIGIRNSGIRQDEGLFSMSDIIGVETEPDLLSELQQDEGSGIFDALRLERSKTRSKSIETLETVARDTGLSDEARAAAGMQLVDLSIRTEAEAEAEALIRARGYKDVWFSLRVMRVM